MARARIEIGVFFIDLILCALGCLLLVMIAQLASQRAPEWDSKALVVNASFAATPRGFKGNRVRVYWTLYDPEGQEVAASRTVVVLPKSRATAPGDDLTFLVPEAMIGRWRLTFQVVAEAKQLQDFVKRELKPSRLDPIVEGYQAYYKKYLDLKAKGRRLRESDIYELVKKRQGFVGKLGVRFGGMNVPLEDDEPVVVYIRLRTALMIWDLLRLSPDGELGINGQGVADWRARVRAIEKELADKARQTSSLWWGFFRGLLIDVGRVDLWTSTLLGARDPSLRQRLRTRVEDLDDLVIRHPMARVENYREGACFLWVSRLIDIRSRLESEGLEDPLTGPVKDGLLELKKRYGERQRLIQILLAECEVAADIKHEVELAAVVRWGDERWPDNRQGPPNEPHRFKIPLDVLGSEHDLLTFMIDGGDSKLRVRTSP